jgi:MYXO-CTERM domain-containing protein
MTNSSLRTSCLITCAVLGIGCSHRSAPAEVRASAQPLYVTGESKVTAADVGPTERFGQSVDLSGDTLVTCASQLPRVYFYVRSGTIWTSQPAPATGSTSTEYGCAVSIDGDTAVWSDGTAVGVKVYVRSGTTWTEQATLTDTRWSDGVAVIGDTIALGSSSGVRLFSRSGTTWAEQTPLVTWPTGSECQSSVSLAIDADLVVAGCTSASGTGSGTEGVHVFARSGTAWAEQDTLTYGGTETFSGFGASVAVSGSTIVVGAPNDNVGAAWSGSAYVFERSGTTWAQQAQLPVSNPRSQLLFGAAVAVSGDVIAVGAPQSTNTLAPPGRTYLFQRSGTTWSEFAVLTASDSTTVNAFGDALAFDGTTLVAGAPWAHVGGYGEAGAVYSYEVLAERVDGSPCLEARECLSGLCVDGVCCDTDCAGPCRACSQALKGQGADGVCGLVADGRDPDDDCPSTGEGVCVGDGVCNAGGLCRAVTMGDQCSPSSCNSLAQQKNADTCNEQGVCTARGNSECAPFLCEGTGSGSGCLTECTDATDCQTGLLCNSGYCGTPVTNGQPCSSDVMCASGHCVDGVCCDAACDGLCESCAAGRTVSGTPGVCSPIRPNTDPDQECEESASACGADGMCDGNGACNRFQASETSCGLDECQGAMVVRKICDGAGACVDDVFRNCTPYACDVVADDCFATCQLDSDCATGSVCNAATGQCAVATDSCADAFTVAHPDGTQTSCAPYACSSGTCLQLCDTDEDCISGTVCDRRQCVEATGAGGGAGTPGASGSPGAAGTVDAARGSGSEDAGGCGCRASRGGSGSGLVALAFAMLVARRRRR